MLEKKLVGDDAIIGICEIINKNKNLRNFRSLEITTVRELLRELTANQDIEIQHKQSGQPFLEDGTNISISHTRGYATVMLSEKHLVGIDIEYISDRVERVVSKFVREDEVVRDTMDKLILWSAKEAVYKLFSEQNLEYFEMRALPFDKDKSNHLIIENLKSNLSQKVYFEYNDKYVLTYCIR